MSVDGFIWRTGWDQHDPGAAACAGEFSGKRSAIGVAFFPYGNHGFAPTESDGYQPELAELVWPLVVSFFGRELGPPAP